MIDQLTLLTAKAGMAMTKTWTPEGILPYDDAQYFKVKSVEVKGIHNLSRLLTKIQDHPRCCIIRGRYIGDEAAEAVISKDATTRQEIKSIQNGYVLRRKTLFEDLPLHSMMIDIDNYQTSWSVLVNPVAAIDQFISEVLPPAFHGVTYHWQLSSSAGQPSKQHILKAHLWFWLSKPYNSDQLTLWAKSVGSRVDCAVYRTVQPHFTAHPVFKDVPDPVPVRSGLEEGFNGDEVPLVLPEAMLREARPTLAPMDIPDPRDKPGVIGAFCRAYTIKDAIEQFLPHVYTLATHRRVTWLEGGGSPEGCYISDRGTELFNTHNTSPFDLRPANAFDLVRHHMYGELDAGLDEFELLRMSDRPSYQAMKSFAESLPEVQAELPTPEERGIEKVERQVKALVDNAEERVSRMLAYRAEIESCADIAVLSDDICRRIGADKVLTRGDLVALESDIQVRTGALRSNGKAARIADVREWLQSPTTVGGFLHLGEGGQPLQTLENLQVVMNEIGALARYNVITKNIEILLNESQSVSDNAREVAINTIISACAERNMGVHLVPNYLTVLAERNLYNPVVTWITSRPWDGVPRFERFMASVEVDPSKVGLRKLLMTRWFVSCVAAAFNPRGLATQGVLVFVSKQGDKKGSFFRQLAPEDLRLVLLGGTLNPADRDSVYQSVGHWVVELAEIDATFRRADVAALKSFITRDRDVMRLPYARTTSEYHRRTVFAGSVNDETFLSDPTGNRRFWTLEPTRINLEHGLDIQQVWAEVYQLYLDGERHYLDDDELAVLNDSNLDYTMVDPMEDRLTALNAFDWGSDSNTWVYLTTTQIAARLGVDHPSRTELKTIWGKVKKLNGNRFKRDNKGRYLAVPGETFLSKNDI